MACNGKITGRMDDERQGIVSGSYCNFKPDERKSLNSESLCMYVGIGKLVIDGRVQYGF